jgi:archaellum component FlaF (FlaF/FlaG flagellin family)
MVLYGVINESVDTYRKASDVQQARYEARNDLAVSIVSAYRDDEQGVLRVAVMNDGKSRTIDPAEGDLLINGELVRPNNISMTVDGARTDLWGPREELELTIRHPALGYFPGINERKALETARGLSGPSDVAVSRDTIFLIDAGAIKMLGLDGSFKGKMTDPNLTSPVAISAVGNDLYIIDNNTHIDRFDFVNRTFSDGLIQQAGFDPVDLFATADLVYVIDGNNTTHVDTFDRDGTAVATPLLTHGNLTAIAVTDRIYLLDDRDHLDAYGLDGTNGTTLVDGADLTEPRDIAVLSGGPGGDRIFVVDDSAANTSCKVEVYDSAGAHVETLGDLVSSTGESRISVSGSIFLSDRDNGLVVARTGTDIKYVAANGISSCVMI